MTGVLHRSRTPDVRSLDRMIDKALAVAFPRYADAVEAMIHDRPDGEVGRLWERWRRTFAKAYALILLNGSATVVRQLVKKRLASFPENEPIPASVSGAFSLDVFDQPFLEAVEPFRTLVPDLHRTIERVARSATEVSSRVRDDERERASRWLDRLTERIIAENPEETPTTIAAKTIRVALTGKEDWQDRHEATTRTALQHAFNDGARQQIRKNADLFPVLRLSEVVDRRTRGNPDGLYPHHGKHFQMDGFVAAADDPIWRDIWPPSGYNCRATVVGVTAYEAERAGWLLPDGSVNVDLLRRLTSKQRRIVSAGEYPDPGYRASARRVLGV